VKSNRWNYYCKYYCTVHKQVNSRVEKVKYAFPSPPPSGYPLPNLFTVYRLQPAIFRFIHATVQISRTCSGAKKQLLST
jgi:hypothetical protein